MQGCERTKFQIQHPPKRLAEIASSSSSPHPTFKSPSPSPVLSLLRKTPPAHHIVTGACVKAHLCVLIDPFGHLTIDGRVAVPAEKYPLRRREEIISKEIY